MYDFRYELQRGIIGRGILPSNYEYRGFVAADNNEEHEFFLRHHINLDSNI
jgi:hypothetical protein